MPANKWALLRYRIIDGKLNKRFPDYPTKEELRSVCEDELYGTLGEHISTSTIEKDLAAMKYEQHLGYYAPIEYCRINKGYYYTNPNYTLADIPLTESEIEALYFAAGILAQFKGLKVVKQFEEAIDKISDVVSISKAVGDDLENNKIIQFEKAPYFKGSHLLTDLVVAIKEQRVVNMFHKGFGREEAFEHTLHPYLVKEFRNRWYVIGWSESAGSIRTYGLDRIESIAAVEGATFKENTEFDPEEFFKFVYGISQPDGIPTEIMLSFTPLQGNYVLTKPLHHTQKIIKQTGDELIISCNVVPNFEFMEQILSFGNHVKVLRPKEIVEAVKGIIAKMSKQYQ
ncbi:MAG TPA: WYL domain-containing protein [Flavobacteriales bacterium]|nr:WYL domain-containing protein [Flavobacteriales bacterium]